MVTTFASRPLDPALRGPLVERLVAVHAVRPLLPDDPRAVAGRVAAELEVLGLSAVRIRGTVSWRGVDVDHVWLAVAGPDEGSWVLDAAFPLHEVAFADALAGWVAGTRTSAELVEIAAATRIEDRVLGAFPQPAAYRGRPYWGSGRN
jgi:hypothetical protein